MRNNNGKFYVLMVFVMIVMGAVGWAISNPPKKERTVIEPPLVKNTIEDEEQNHAPDKNLWKVDNCWRMQIVHHFKNGEPVGFNLRCLNHGKQPYPEGITDQDPAANDDVSVAGHTQ